MADNSRLEDLRRRVQKDPASIAFAQLAEEYRRAGQYQEAVDACRTGLAIHPGYLSARVTLGRALLEKGDLDVARAEFEIVLKSAPENLAAVRGLAEVFHRHGNLAEALVQYRAALNLARNDPDLEQTVDDLTRQLAPKKRALFETESAAPSVVSPAAPSLVAPPVIASSPVVAPPPIVAPLPVVAPPPPPLIVPAPAADTATAPPPLPIGTYAEAAAAPLVPAPDAPAAATKSSDAPPEPAVQRATSPEQVPAAALPAAAPPMTAPSPAVPAGTVPAAAETQVKQTIEALEQWLDAIHVSRSDRSS